MKSIKVKSSAERADELLRDPEAYFRRVREEVRQNLLRSTEGPQQEPSNPQSWFGRLVRRLRRG